MSELALGPGRPPLCGRAVQGSSLPGGAEGEVLLDSERLRNSSKVTWGQISNQLENQYEKNLHYSQAWGAKKMF